jgi:GcrA cell cycle regulator
MGSWSPVDTQRLKDLWAAGKSARSIAFEFIGRTRNAIIGKTHRLGLADRVARLNPHGPASVATHKEPQRRRPRSEMLAPRPRIRIEKPLGPREMAAHAVGFMELKDHHCRAVIDLHDPSNGLAVYCGAPRMEDRSYCYSHFKQYTLPRR